MDSKEKLALRIQEATPDDTVMGLFFLGTLAYLTEVLGAGRTEILQLSVLGERKEFIGFFKYPVGDLLRLIQGGLEQAGVGAKVDDFLRGLGHTITRQNKDTPVVKAVSQLGKKQAHAVLSAALTGFTTVASWGTRKHEQVGEREARVSARRELLGPALFVGLCEKAVMAQCEVTVTPTAELLNPSGSDFNVTLRW